MRTFDGMSTKTKGRRTSRSRINAKVPTAAKRRLKKASDEQDRSMTDVLTHVLENALPEPPERHIPTGRTWVDDIAGTARFTDDDIKDDERLARLVKGARTKGPKDQ